MSLDQMTAEEANRRSRRGHPFLGAPAQHRTGGFPAPNVARHIGCVMWRQWSCGGDRQGGIAAFERHITERLRRERA